MNTPKHSGNNTLQTQEETPQRISKNISSALYYLEREAKIVGMRGLAAKIHLAALEAEVLADDLS